MTKERWVETDSNRQPRLILYFYFSIRFKWLVGELSCTPPEFRCKLNSYFLSNAFPKEIFSHKVHVIYPPRLVLVIFLLICRGQRRKIIAWLYTCEIAYQGYEIGISPLWIFWICLLTLDSVEKFMPQLAQAQLGLLI